MKNIEVAKILYEIAEMLEMRGVAFKPRAYQRAARSVESLSEDIEKIYEEDRLNEIPGVGENIAKKIFELIKTGRLRYYEELKRKMPMKVDELIGVSGLGPKRIMILYKKLGVRNIKDLTRVAKEHKIQRLQGFGLKTEEDILRGIEFVKKKTGRFLLGYIIPVAEEIKENIKKLKSVEQVEIAGSYRRRKETVGDLDILVISSKPREVMEFIVNMPDVSDVLAKGETKTIIRLKNGLKIDVRVLEEKEYGSALQYFTGNKEHNIELRKIALKKGYSLSEYELFGLRDKKLVAGRSEEEIYKKLGAKYIPPEMRENKGEIQLSLHGKLPKLIEEKDIIGDFQMHSEWSDGVNSIEEMAGEAIRLGHRFIAITDHVGQLAIANALNERRLEKQIKIINKLNNKFNLRIFKGAEVDILKNGQLALSRKMQEKLDVVLASVHSGFKIGEKEMTARICRALENNRVHILAHPTGRLLNERESYPVNFEKLFDLAKKKEVFFEINCYPERMDLDGEKIKMARDVGCKFSIGTDSHSKEHLRYLKLGSFLARRGWLEKKDILNCFSIGRIEKILGGK